MEKRKDRIIVALDVADIESCKELVDKLYPTIKIFKIGSQLFTACGVEAVNMLNRKGAEIFLDLKFHDIPSTVAKASKAATSLGLFMFNMHASGGLDMMKSSLEASREASEKLKVKKPLILGVTILTSMAKDDLKAMGITKGIKQEVLFLAGLVKKAGLDGVVASANEILPIKKKFGDDLIILTPGIRPEWAQQDDQKRVATPKEAFDKGADYIVIGRPITEVDNPKAAAERIIGEI